MSSSRSSKRSIYCLHKLAVFGKNTNSHMVPLSSSKSIGILLQEPMSNVSGQKWACLTCCWSFLNFVGWNFQQHWCKILLIWINVYKMTDFPFFRKKSLRTWVRSQDNADRLKFSMNNYMYAGLFISSFTRSLHYWGTDYNTPPWSSILQRVRVIMTHG